jgi:hypothetical protein
MKKTCAVILAISMATLWAGGCQEEQASSDVRQARLIAAENGDLNRQLQAKGDEIKKLNEQIKGSPLHAEVKKRDDEIKNLNEKNLNEKNLNKQLQAEREKLNADVDNLSKQLAECVQEKQAVAEKAEKDIEKRSEELSEGIVTPILNEMKGLKAEIAQLKTELSNCDGKK